MRGVKIDPERREIRLLRRHIPFEGARVLEIGCGKGRLTRRMAGITRTLVSTDVNRSDVATAQRLLPGCLDGKVRFAVDSAATLAFRDHSFDVVVLAWSL